MHEVSLVASVVEHASLVLAGGQAEKVLSVTLRRGLLSGADPEALRFCFPHVARGTPLEGAVLHIVEQPLELSCETCGSLTKTRELHLICGDCSGDRVSVTAGGDLIIESMEVC